MCRRIVVLAVVLQLMLAAFASRTARARDRLPAARAVIFDPTDSKTLYVRTTFGLVATRDGGTSWRWICERAASASTMEDPSWVVTPKGTLVGATAAGVVISRDHGCHLARAEGIPASTYVLSDLALGKDGEIFGALTVQGVDGRHESRLYSSKDDGGSFTVVGAIEPTLRVQSIGIAESDPARMYLSAVRGQGSPGGDGLRAVLLASYDGGESWVERPVALASGETAFDVAGVDPKNADRVYLRTMAAEDDGKVRLLVTDDAGKTSKRIFDSPSAILGFALAPDGARVFAGNREGLVASPTDAFAFTKAATAAIQCLGLNDKALWACSTERSGFFVGVSRGGGRSFDAKLHIDELEGPVECGTVAGGGPSCAEAWSSLRSELGLPDDTKPRNTGTGGPTLRGRNARTTRTRNPLGVVFAISLVGLAGYYVLKRLRRG